MTAGRLAGVLCVAALMAVVTVATPTTAAAEDWSGDANLFVGRKALKSGGWDSVNRQSDFGVEVSWGKKEWPIRIATDLLVTSQKKTESGVDRKGGTSEFDLGFRKIWDKNHLHPFFGGGMAILTGTLKTTSAGVSDEEHRNSSGVWVGGGAFWRLGPRINLGGEARVSTGVIKFSGQGSDAGGIQAGVVLGFHWPGGK
ncbi:MAG TPA: hypothetical protein VKL61_01880 [Candidatus Polarisedimenticolia bacterium]|nr:hypothetical protein [Candidatus Polarisedimenticolia bacterium]